MYLGTFDTFSNSKITQTTQYLVLRILAQVFAKYGLKSNYRKPPNSPNKMGM